MNWPIREALLAYLNKMREQARQQHDTDVLVWAVQSPYCKAAPPKVPEILKG